MKIGRKLEVFVGSTTKDLEKERSAIVEAIQKAGHIANAMELWSPGPLATKDDIRLRLDHCDIHVLIVKARYGYTPPDTASDKSEDAVISITEWEYRQSALAQRPVIAFLLDDREFEKVRKREVKRDPEENKNDAKLAQFRTELKTRVCRLFKEEDDLTTPCITAINEVINRNQLKDDAGWIRASSEDARLVLGIERNPFLKEIINSLYRFSTLTTRILDEEVAKRAMARAFWNLMVGRMRRKGYYNVFFESGSSLAFVSDRFQKIVLSDAADVNKWKVTTNNVLTLLQLLLHTNVDVKPLPSGAPDDKYGAMFGADLLQYPEAQPIKPRSLFPAEEEAVKKMCQQLQQGVCKGVGKKGILLATTSGVDLDHPIQGFRGLHVGSHPNMLFKRALLRAGLPLVIFLTASKFGARFEDGKCYPICDRGLTWNTIRKECPMAFCIGFEKQKTVGVGYTQVQQEAIRLHNERNALERVDKALRKWGFDPEYASEGDENSGAILAANEAFASRKYFPQE